MFISNINNWYILKQFKAFYKKYKKYMKRNIRMITTKFYKILFWYNETIKEETFKLFIHIHVICKNHLKLITKIRESFEENWIVHNSLKISIRWAKLCLLIVKGKWWNHF